MWLLFHLGKYFLSIICYLFFYDDLKNNQTDVIGVGKVLLLQMSLIFFYFETENAGCNKMKKNGR